MTRRPREDPELRDLLVYMSSDARSLAHVLIRVFSDLGERIDELSDRLDDRDGAGER